METPARRLRVELIMEVESERKVEFEEAWLEVGRVVAAHPENIAQWLSVRRDDSHQYVIISDWPDEAAFRRFEKEAGHIELTSKLHALRKKGSMTMQDVIYYLPGEKAQ